MMDREMQRDRELQREMQAPPAGYGTRAAAGYDTAPRTVAAAAPAEGTPLVQSQAGTAGAAKAAAAEASPPLWVAATVQVTCPTLTLILTLTLTPAPTPTPNLTLILTLTLTAQVTCLLFGVTRNFLKFGFESAMVVVYDRQLMLSEVRVRVRVRSSSP